MSSNQLMSQLFKGSFATRGAAPVLPHLFVIYGQKLMQIVH